MINNKAIVLYPYRKDDIKDTSNTSTAIVNQLREKGYEIKTISMYDSLGSYRIDAEKDAFSLINAGFIPAFMLALDYGPWIGQFWNKINFPNTLLVYESGDEPQSHYSHVKKAYSSDLILTSDYRCFSMYSEVFRKNSLWWPQFAIDEQYSKDMNVMENICVTTCGDRGEVTRYMSEKLGKNFANRRVWGDEHAKFLASGLIVFQESKNKEITRRVFEGAALGRCVLADRPAESSRYYDLLVEGREIIWYDGKEDAVKKAKHLLDNPDLALEIGDNAKNAVRKKHMCSSRVESLIKKLEETL